MLESTETKGRVIERGTLTGAGYLLVQITATTIAGSSAVWGTVVVDIRRGGGGGGSLRAARASVDYDPANGRRVRCAAITMPHTSDEDYKIFMEEEGEAAPTVSVRRVSFK